MKDEILAKLCNLVRIGLCSDTKTICVRVRSLVDTKTLTKGKKYWGIRQAQLQGWYSQRQFAAITLVGDIHCFGARDYSLKRFEVLEEHKVSLSRLTDAFDAVSGGTT